MVCIYCNDKTTVINSRKSIKEHSVWRRRQCLACKAIFTSREHPELASTLMVKRNSSEPLSSFQRDKLFISIHRSVSHRNTALSDAQGLTDTIINAILALPHRGIVSVPEIVSITKSVLANFDKAAHSHYSAYHPE